MSDTIGNLIDKLFTVDMKMWTNQENIFCIRKMTFDEFKEKFVDDIEGAKALYGYLHKGCDLNMQRNELMDEIDKCLIEMFKSFSEGQELDAGKFIQRKHKTY